MSVGVPRDEPASEGPEDRAESARLEAEVRRIRGRAAFASEASIALLSASLDLEQVIERLIRLAVPELGDGCVVFLADARGDLRMSVGKHREPAKDEVLQRFLAGFVPDPSKAMIYEVFRTAQTFYVAETPEDLLRAWGQSEAEVEELRSVEIRSVVIVPMVAHGRSVGVLTVGTTGDRPFAEDDVAAVSDLGEKAALAIDNANLYAGEHRARMRTELLQVLTTDLARALTSEEIADVITHHGLAVGADAAALWEVDPAGRRATFVRAVGDVAGWDEHASVPLDGDTTIEHVLSRNVPLFIDSAAEYEKAFRTPQQRIPAWNATLSSFAFLPLVVGEQRLGVLVFAFAGERPPGPDERALLLVAAGHAAQALYRAKLYEAERRSREEVGLLYDLLDAFNKAETVAEVFEPAIDAVHLGLGVTRSSILLFDDQGVMRFRAWRGLSDEYRRTVEGHTPWPHGTLDPYPVQVPDVRADPSLEAFLPLFAKEGISALAFIPLVHQRELMGKFMVYSDRPRQFTEDEIRLARLIASQIAYAVARKVSEAQAEEARRAAERANRLKDEFLAVVSHELRTPLSAIVGWSSILRDPQGTDAATMQKGLEVIDRNAKTQAKIIGDILDVSRIITGKLVIDQRTTSLVAVVGEALEAVRAPALAKGIELEFHHADEPYALVGDADRLRQVVWNLLSNAIKFTPRGGRVEARLRRDLGSIVLEVQDTGIGIGPDFLRHVFERFRQADSSTTRREGGLGLGLAIVRHLVELHGGQVRVESAGLGKGTTFSVVLPVRALQPTPAPEAEPVKAPGSFHTEGPRSPAVLNGVRVLVVDDEDDARELLREALGAYGAVVETAASATECIGLLGDFAPDVLVSDIGMPGEDGYKLIRRLREKTPPGELPAIALTAFARPEDEQRALEAGFQKHVAKPVEPATLARAVRDLARAARTESSRAGE